MENIKRIIKVKSTSAHDESVKKRGMKYFRERILLNMLLLLLLSGLIFYFQTIVAAASGGPWNPVVLSTILYLWSGSILYYRNIPYKIRAINAITIFYIIGFFLLYLWGPMGVSSIWFFVLPVITAVVLDLQSSLIALLLNTLIFSISTIHFSQFNLLDWYTTIASDREKWLVFGIVFIFLDGIISTSIALLIQGFEETLKKEMALADAWVNERKNLIEANGRLKGEIVERKKVESALEKIEKRATFYEFYDVLTELPNKEMFVRRLQVEVLKSSMRNRLFAVMCIGVDKFKKINEMHGPSVGDQILKRVANRLRNAFREDDLVSRFSGDKFMVLFADMGSNDGLVDIVQKTLDIFIDDFDFDGLLLKLSTTIGVCVYPNDGDNCNLIVKHSEAAMYMAKEKGNNSYAFYDAGMNSEIVNRMKVEDELYIAVEENQFEPYFQPKVNKDGVLVGMESLVRWNSPKRGFVSPFEFIPIAEKNGIIVEIGRIMFRESCKKNVEWQKQGLKSLKVAVNVSPFEFKSPTLIDDLKQVIDATGLDPKWIEIEITESGIMDDETYSITKLNELHDLGISISIDDFGTGYSSLSKLKDYPVDTLKIDKSFVDHLPDDKKSVTIVKSIIDLAHNLGFNVVAEGVENKEQLDMLVDYNCDIFQGYYFYKPLNAEVFEKELKKV